MKDLGRRRGSPNSCAGGRAYNSALTFPSRHAFQELPNVLMTPHVSGWTEGMPEARAKLIAENIHRTARGEPPVNLIPSPE